MEFSEKYSKYLVGGIDEKSIKEQIISLANLAYEINNNNTNNILDSKNL